MVEAVIVFPIVLLTVFVLIYLGLFKLQEMAMLYQVQRVAHQGAHVLANPGYRELGDYTQKAIDFSSDPSMSTPTTRRHMTIFSFCTGRSPDMGHGRARENYSSLWTGWHKVR